MATQHFAFTVREADIKRPQGYVEKKGVSVSEPVYHQWM